MGVRDLQINLGQGMNHSEGCRLRIEKIIAEDETDERTGKTKERLDHYLAQQVDNGDMNKESVGDPRPNVQGAAPPHELRDEQEPRAVSEHYVIGSPMKDDDMASVLGTTSRCSERPPIYPVTAGTHRRREHRRQSAIPTSTRKSLPSRGV